MPVPFDLKVHDFLTLSTLRAGPFFSVSKIPDNIYEKVPRHLYLLINKTSYLMKASLLISQWVVSSDTLMLRLSIHYPPRQTQTRKLKTDTYWFRRWSVRKQPSNLFIKYNDDDNMQLLIEPSSDTEHIENTSSLSSRLKSCLSIKDVIWTVVTSSLKLIFACCSIRKNPLSLSRPCLVAWRHYSLLCSSYIWTIDTSAPTQRLVARNSTGGLKLRYFKRSSGQSEIDGL